MGRLSSPVLPPEWPAAGGCCMQKRFRTPCGVGAAALSSCMAGADVSHGRIGVLPAIWSLVLQLRRLHSSVNFESAVVVRQGPFRHNHRVQPVIKSTCIHSLKSSVRPGTAGAAAGAVPAAARGSVLCAAAAGAEAGARCEARSSGVQQEGTTAGLLRTLCLVNFAAAPARRLALQLIASRPH